MEWLTKIPPKAQYFLTEKPQAQHPRASRGSNASCVQARCSGCAQHAAKKRDTVGEQYQTMHAAKRALFETPFQLFSLTQFLSVLKSERFNINLGTWKCTSGWKSRVFVPKNFSKNSFINILSLFGLRLQKLVTRCAKHEYQSSRSPKLLLRTPY